MMTVTIPGTAYELARLSEADGLPEPIMLKRGAGYRVRYEGITAAAAAGLLARLRPLSGHASVDNAIRYVEGALEGQK